MSDEIKTDEEKAREGIKINSNRGGTIYRDKAGNEIDAPNSEDSAVDAIENEKNYEKPKGKKW